MSRKFYLVEIKASNAIVVELDTDSETRDLTDLAIEYAEGCLSSEALNNADYEVNEITTDEQLDIELRYANQKCLIK